MFKSVKPVLNLRDWLAIYADAINKGSTSEEAKGIADVQAIQKKDIAKRLSL